MYERLLEALKRESERAELQPLSKSFYVDLSEFMRKIIEDRRASDESTLRGRLLSLELSYLRRLLGELVELRLQKLMAALSGGGGPPREALTLEEEVLVAKGTSLLDSVRAMIEDIAEGRKPRLAIESVGPQPGKVLLRFLKETPAIVGVDMKPYGPFKPEDVALLPAENAEALLKQGAAQRIELTRG